ncbi:MAG: class I adenylate-forming enzyme family protein [Pseudomonadales bacterium]|jgi:long-chain acyl-CoA synthetase|nr:class I adenylate-forming enzyme family protein [Pseudomonadales bacterium]
MYAEYKQAWEAMTGPGGDFEITSVDVRGNPTRTYKNAPPSLREFWLSSAQFAEREYLVYEDERWTYAEAHAEVAAIASWLWDQGVRPGDTVAIAMRNYPEYMLLYWGIVSMGAVVMGMNAWWVGPEMVFALKDAKPKVIFGDGERLEHLAPHVGEFPEAIFVSVRAELDYEPKTFHYATDVRTHRGTLPDVTIDPDSDACIFYTSGTTGHPKGAQQTHRGCVNNVMNLAFAAGVSAAAGVARGVIDPATLENPPQGVSLVTTPLFHVTANNCVAQGATLSGGKLVLMYKWDAGKALELIERERVSNMSGVPVMSRELIAHPDFETRDTSSLLALGGGGAQLQPDLVGRIDEKVATARPGTGYGMTETCGIITSISGDYFVDKPESCGPVMPNFELRIIDDDGNEVPQGEVGELTVRGAPVIRGYLNRPEATAETIVDGFLRTGDLARVDEDGFVFIVDRKKDMVLRGGENVYCAEVESALFDHVDVAECVVFGVPDDRLGEEVGACIVRRAGASISAEALREHCMARISKHKVPRYIWFQDEPLPRNANGKFLKREVREALSLADAA